jgi:hypothetical protein
MVTAQELIVAIRSEGVDDTTDDLETMEETFTDTSDSAQDTSEDLEGFTKRTKGALSAALVGITALGAGLATQIPVLGELSSAFGAVFSAFGLQASQLLRDLGIGRVIDLLFNFSNMVFNAEGALGDLAGALTLVVVGVSALVSSFAGLGLVIPGLTASGAVGFLSSLASTAVSAATALLSLPVAFAALVAAVVGFGAAYALGLGNIREKTDETATSINQKFKDFAKDVRQELLDLTGGKITGERIISALKSQFQESKKDGILSWFDGLGADIDAEVSSIISSVGSFGSDLIDDVIGGFNETEGEKGGQIALWFDSLGADIDKDISSILSSASDFGADIINNIISRFTETEDEKGGQIAGFFSGLKTDLFGDGGDIPQILSSLEQFGNNIIQRVIQGLKNAPGSIADVLDDRLPGNISLGGLRDALGVADNDTGESSGQSASGAGATGQTETGGFIGQFAIDGRALAESTGRQRRDPLARNGGV